MRSNRSEDLQRRIATLSKPVVTRLHGNVRAGGIGIVAASDIAISAVDANGTLTYTPTAAYSGPDQLTYTVSDGRGGFDSASVAISVVAAGPMPVVVGNGFGGVLFHEGVYYWYGEQRNARGERGTGTSRDPLHAYAVGHPHRFGAERANRIGFPNRSTIVQEREGHQIVAEQHALHADEREHSGELTA